MKKLIATVLSIALFTGAALAQPQKTEHSKQQHHQMKSKQHGKHAMAHHLQLSAEQKEKAKVIGENYRKQVTELKKNDNITMGAYKKQMATLQAERKTKMDALLTTEQKATIAQHKQKKQEDMQVTQAAHLERMKIKLGLKEEQVASIKANQANFTTKAKAIHDNDKLSGEEKKEQIKALAKTQKDSFKSVLTKEQQEKLESRKKAFTEKAH